MHTARRGATSRWACRCEIAPSTAGGQTSGSTWRSERRRGTSVTAASASSCLEGGEVGAVTCAQAASATRESESGEWVTQSRWRRLLGQPSRKAPAKTTGAVSRCCRENHPWPLRSSNSNIDCAELSVGVGSHLPHRIDATTSSTSLSRRPLRHLQARRATSRAAGPPQPLSKPSREQRNRDGCLEQLRAFVPSCMALPSSLLLLLRR